MLLRTSERREVTWVVIEAANRWIVRGSGYTDLDRNRNRGSKRRKHPNINNSGYLTVRVRESNLSDYCEDRGESGRWR